MVNEFPWEKIRKCEESTFQVSDKVSTHNCRIWGSENPRVSLEHLRDSPKVNVLCALSKEIVYGPFFMETPITSSSFHSQTKMTKKDAFTSSKTAHAPITLEKGASTSIPVSQVGGLAERCRWLCHLIPRIIHPWIFWALTIPVKTR
jgi:hypothetical protein